MAETIWVTPLDDECQLCGDSFKGVMFDAKVFGSWGNVCNSCFTSDNRAKLGTGYGQKYKLQQRGTNKYWVKVA